MKATTQEQFKPLANLIGKTGPMHFQCTKEGEKFSLIMQVVTIKIRGDKDVGLFDVAGEQTIEIDSTNDGLEKVGIRNVSKWTFADCDQGQAISDEKFEFWLRYAEKHPEVTRD